MQRCTRFVNKKLAYPGYGAKNRVRFKHNEVLLELPCSECGAIVTWKRKPFGSGGQLRQAFDDYEPELAGSCDDSGNPAP